MKKSLVLLSLLSLISCAKTSEESVFEHNAETMEFSEPLQFEDEYLLASAMLNDQPVTKAGDDFVSYASTVMTQEGYDDLPYAIDSERIGRLLNPAGEVYFGDNILKVSRLGTFLSSKSKANDLRMLAENDDLYCMLGDIVVCPLVSGEKKVYSIKGYDGVYFYDTFGFLVDSKEEDLSTRAVTDSYIKVFPKNGNLFGAYVVVGEPDWGATFTVPPSGDQKRKFTNDNYCNDTKIYHKYYVVATDTGIKTKTMRKKLAWSKIEGELEAGIINTVVYENAPSDYAQFFNGNMYNFNYVYYGASSKKFLIATRTGSSGSAVKAMTNDQVLSAIAAAENYAASLGRTFKVDGIRFAINADEAYTRFPNDVSSETVDKIEMSFILDFGGNAGTMESLIESSPMKKFLAKYRIERQELYGKSIRGTEERGSKMIYTY